MLAAFSLVWASITFSTWLCLAAISLVSFCVSAATIALRCKASVRCSSNTVADLACSICCLYFFASCWANSRLRMISAISCGGMMSRISTELMEMPQVRQFACRNFSSSFWKSWRLSPTMNSVAVFLLPSMRAKPLTDGKISFLRMSSMSPTSWERQGADSAEILNSTVPSSEILKPSMVMKTMASSPLNS